MDDRRKQRGRPLPDKSIRELKKMVAERGERAVAEACGVSRDAFARVLAGLPVYRGTIALVERALDAARASENPQ